MDIVEIKNKSRFFIKKGASDLQFECGEIDICDNTHIDEYQPVPFELNKKESCQLYEAMKIYYENL